MLLLYLLYELIIIIGCLSLGGHIYDLNSFYFWLSKTRPDAATSFQLRPSTFHIHRELMLTWELILASTNEQLKRICFKTPL